MNRTVRALINLVSDNDYLTRHKRYRTDFLRARKLPASVVIWTILRLMKRSLALECIEMLWDNSTECSPTKQAFSQARYKWKHTGFIEMHDTTVGAMYDDPTFGLWRGYRVIGADGSSLRLPDTADVVEKFGYHKPNGTGGKMPPIGRVSLFIDLCLLGVVSARLDNWSRGEGSLAQEQLPAIVASLKQDNLLFVYDRGYTSIKFIKQHVELGVDFLFRVSSGSYKKLWKRAVNGESDFEDKILGVSVRVVSFILDTGERELLITSVSQAKASREDIGRLYTHRWQLEECYKKFKVSMEIENFSGNNLEAVLQDFWAHMVMMNIATEQINTEQEPLNPDKSPTHRINFSIFFGVMRGSLFRFINGEISARRLTRKLKTAMKTAKNKIRPGRSYSRAKMKIPKRHKVFFRTC